MKNCIGQWLSSKQPEVRNKIRTRREEHNSSVHSLDLELFSRSVEKYFLETLFQFLSLLHMWVDDHLEAFFLVIVCNFLFTCTLEDFGSSRLAADP